VSGRVPYYFSRVPVADMIPTKEAHTHPLFRLSGPTGGAGIRILFPWPVRSESRPPYFCSPISSYKVHSN
jgi:hypothetical protein